MCNNIYYTESKKKMHRHLNISIRIRIYGENVKNIHINIQNMLHIKLN